MYDNKTMWITPTIFSIVNFNYTGTCNHHIIESPYYRYYIVLTGTCTVNLDILPLHANRQISHIVSQNLVYTNV